jgi:DNA-binding transcriptional MerR regulator
MPGRLTIGQLAEVTCVPPKTVRYYEEVGILPPPQRSESGYRLYTDVDVRRLELIRRARAVDRRIADLEQLKQDLQRMEAHFTKSEKEARADHTMLECSPETCTCLGGTHENQKHRQEVKSWLNQSRLKS